MDDWKTFDRNNKTLLIIFSILKENKHVQLVLQNISQPVKNKQLSQLLQMKKKKHGMILQ